MTKLHYPRKGQIQVHQSRVSRCPEEWPVGYFWYGARRHSLGRPPKWVQQLLERSVGELDDSEAPTCSETILDVELATEPSVPEVPETSVSEDHPLDTKSEHVLPRTKTKYSLGRSVKQPQRLLRVKGLESSPRRVM